MESLPAHTLSINATRRKPSLAMFFCIGSMLAVCAIHCGYEYKIWWEWTVEPDCWYVWKDGRTLAGDFVEFAAVVEAWQTNDIDNLYNLDNQSRLMGKVAKLGKDYPWILSYNYPPFFCWLLRPLVGLNYLQMFVAWTIIMCWFGGVAALLWRDELRGRSGFRLILAIFLLCPAVCNCLMLGHVAFFGLFATTLFFRLLNTRREFAAGMALSLLFYKPTLGIVFGPILLYKFRWRAVLGVGFGAGLLYLASRAVSLKAMADFPTMGKELFKLATTHDDYFCRHSSWFAAVCTAACRNPVDLKPLDWFVFAMPAAAVFLFLLIAWRGRYEPGTDRFSAQCSATVLATLILTPYAYSYDTMLLLVAGVYTIKTLPNRPRWHAWLVLGAASLAGYYITGDANLVDRIRKSAWLIPWIDWRVQLAPIALMVWFCLEAWYAGRRPPTSLSTTTT